MEGYGVCQLMDKYAVYLITCGWRSAGRKGGFTLFACGVVCKDAGVARVSVPRVHGS